MKSESPSRTYRQTARAQAASETGERILDAFIARVRNGWFDEVRLDDVAADAGVTVQTVIRRFGGKEGLLDAGNKKLSAQIMGSRRLPVGDVAAAIGTIVQEYEDHGELIMRLLAQEERYAAIREITDTGRSSHRRWVGEVFAPWLKALDEPARCHAHDQLVIALDLYVWKLVRVDMKRSVATLRQTMLKMCACALNTDAASLGQAAILEKTDV